MPEAPQPRCPVCNTPLRPVGAKPGEGKEWVCPVALEAQRRGILGQPGKKHKQVLIYRTK
jgi:hypothetical protein